MSDFPEGYDPRETQHLLNDLVAARQRDSQLEQLRKGNKLLEEQNELLRLNAMTPEERVRYQAEKRRQEAYSREYLTRQSDKEAAERIKAGLSAAAFISAGGIALNLLGGLATALLIVRDVGRVSHSYFSEKVSLTIVGGIIGGVLGIYALIKFPAERRPRGGHRELRPAERNLLAKWTKPGWERTVWNRVRVNLVLSAASIILPILAMRLVEWLARR